MRVLITAFSRCACGGLFQFANAAMPSTKQIREHPSRIIYGIMHLANNRLAFHPRKLIGLWDMMQFYVSVFIGRLDWLQLNASRIHDLANDGGVDGKVENRDAAELSSELKAIWNVCHSMGMKGSVAMCRNLVGALRKAGTRPYSVIESGLLGIRDEIRRELGEIDFVLIERGDAQYFERDNLFGKGVAARFVEAGPEIKSAGNCIAFGLHTAAVFHLMRVAELGLRRLAKSLKVPLPYPIELATWDKVIAAIQGELDRLKNLPKSKAKDRKQQFQSGLLLDIRAFKHLWRNPVMHNRGRYDGHQARSAFEHIKAFMEKLA